MPKKFDRINQKNILNTRRTAWPKNAINSIFSKFYKRDETLWVFAACEGNRYEDNSRYLFEYVNRNCPNIKAVWITRSSKVEQELTNNGFLVARIGSATTMGLLKIAGFAFYTHGIDDFGEDIYLYGAHIFNLTHAISGIKKDYYLQPWKANNKIYIIMKKAKDAAFDWYKFDYCTISSNEAKKWRMAVHHDHDEKKYIMTGIARNDALRNKGGFLTNRPNFMQPDKTYVAYLPTYRPYENTVIKDLILAMVNDSALIKHMEEHRIVFLVKLHPIDVRSSKVELNTSAIKYVEKNATLSTQDLLYYADVLVTDYSSACMDFSIMDKPVVLYSPDIEKYDKLHGLVDLWKEILLSDDVARDYTNFRSKLMDALQKKPRSYKLTEYLHETYEDEKLKGCSYCENIIDFIRNRYSLESIIPCNFGVQNDANAESRR